MYFWIDLFCGDIYVSNGGFFVVIDDSYCYFCGRVINSN